MRLVLVIDDVLQVDTRRRIEVPEKFLVENEGHARDLLHSGLRLALPVHQIGSNCDSKSSSEFFPLETYLNIFQYKQKSNFQIWDETTFKCVPLSIRTDENIKLVLRNGMIRWANFSFPTNF